MEIILPDIDHNCMNAIEKGIQMGVSAFPEAEKIIELITTPEYDDRLNQMSYLDTGISMGYSAQNPGRVWIVIDPSIYGIGVYENDEQLPYMIYGAIVKATELLFYYANHPFSASTSIMRGGKSFTKLVKMYLPIFERNFVESIATKYENGDQYIYQMLGKTLGEYDSDSEEYCNNLIPMAFQSYAFEKAGMEDLNRQFSNLLPPGEDLMSHLAKNSKNEELQIQITYMEFMREIIDEYTKQVRSANFEKYCSIIKAKKAT